MPAKPFPQTTHDILASMEEIWATMYDGGADTWAYAKRGAQLQTLGGLLLTRAIEEAGTRLTAGATGVFELGTRLDTTLAGLQKTLAEGMNEYSRASAESARALVAWTRGLALATIVLAVFTAVLAVDAGRRLGWW